MNKINVHLSLSKIHWIYHCYIPRITMNENNIKLGWISRQVKNLNCTDWNVGTESTDWVSTESRNPFLNNSHSLKTDKRICRIWNVFLWQTYQDIKIKYKGKAQYSGLSVIKVKETEAGSRAYRRDVLVKARKCLWCFHFWLSGGRSTDPSSFLESLGRQLYETGFSLQQKKVISEAKM